MTLEWTGILSELDRKQVTHAFREALGHPSGRTITESNGNTDRISEFKDVTVRANRNQNTVTVEVSFDHLRDGFGGVVTDDITRCELHTPSNTPTHLSELGDTYAALSEELLTATALMCGIPTDRDDFANAVLGDPDFQASSCLDGTLTFTLMVNVRPEVLRVYSDHEKGLTDELDIPL